MKTGADKWMDGFRSNSFHYSWDEYECVGAHGAFYCLCVWVHTCACLLWPWVLCAFGHACDVLCITLCVCTGVFLVVCIVCSVGWAPLLWQLPAAKGLVRWHCWNGADLFVNVSVFVLFCGCISNESYESCVCVCHKSERELDQMKGNPGTRLNPIPTRLKKN